MDKLQGTRSGHVHEVQIRQHCFCTHSHVHRSLPGHRRLDCSSQAITTDIEDTNVAARRRIVSVRIKTVSGASPSQDYPASHPSGIAVCTHQPTIAMAMACISSWRCFPQKAFELWWQLRVLGQPYPPMLCPWCEPRPELTSTHLRTECSTFATACWIRGIQPEEAFLYPSGPAWFQAALLAVHEIQRAADCL